MKTTISLKNSTHFKDKTEEFKEGLAIAGLARTQDAAGAMHSLSPVGYCGKTGEYCSEPLK